MSKNFFRTDEKFSFGFEQFRNFFLKFKKPKKLLILRPAVDPSGKI